MPHHIALYLSASEHAPQLIEAIMAGERFAFAAGLSSQRGALFSMVTIRRLIDEELLHDDFIVPTANGHSLATSSSGEQRKALLQYLIAQQPDYLIADNVFESLDRAGQQDIVAQLQALSDAIMIIQLMYRRQDCLPFIDRVATIQQGKLVSEQSRSAFMQQQAAETHFKGRIPPPMATSLLPSTELVRMHNVSVQFDGRPVLNAVNWQIKAGEFWQLVGPNGAGKSTLLNMITGDNEKGYGQALYLFGKKKGSGETVWEVKQHIGYFTPALTREFPRIDSIESIIVGGLFDSVGLYQVPGDRQLQLAREWLQLLGLLHMRQRPFRDCTAGQQRLILIARAMIKHPPLLILDEPTAGLDDAQAALFIALVNKISAESTTAIVYVSHRPEAGLQARQIFELVPAAGGATGTQYVVEN